MIKLYFLLPFIFIPFWLLLSYTFIILNLAILRKKAKSKTEKDCLKNFFQPRRNPLLSKEEIQILSQIDCEACKKLRITQLISVGSVVLFTIIMIFIKIIINT